MPDGSDSEQLNIRPSSESRTSRVWREIRSKFGGKAKEIKQRDETSPPVTKWEQMDEPERSHPQPQLHQRHKTVKEQEEKVGRWSKNPSEDFEKTDGMKDEEEKRSLQGTLDRELARKNLTPPEYNEHGASGFFGTNEQLNPAKMHEIKNSDEAPNGYIVGAGVSSMISALEMFKDGQPPKGMIFINIDPASIRDAKGFVEGLKQGEVPYTGGGGEKRRLKPEDYKGSDPYRMGSGNIDTYSMLLKHANTLIKLAKEGKIAVIQHDLFNPDLLDSVKNLDGFDDSRNVVYLSNVGDWIRREGAWGDNGIAIQEWDHMAKNNGQGLSDEYRRFFWLQKFACYDNLKSLQPAQSNFNYFVDTSDRRDYQLQVSKHIPRAISYVGY